MRDTFPDLTSVFGEPLQRGPGIQRHIRFSARSERTQSKPIKFTDKPIEVNQTKLRNRCKNTETLIDNIK